MRHPPENYFRIRFRGFFPRTDPAFASERVRSDAASLFAATQAAWDARDRERLGQLVGPDLLAEWTRRLADFARKGWHNRVAVDPERVKIDYVDPLTRRGIAMTASLSTCKP